MKQKPKISAAVKWLIAVAAVTLALLVAVLCARKPMSDWLANRERQQAVQTAQEVMELLFREPDWGEIYDVAKLEPTKFEGREEYIRYMQDKVGDTPLTCEPVPNESGDEYRCAVSLEGEELAAFTLRRGTDGEGKFAGWQLGGVEARVTRQLTVNVTVLPGCTVYINGVLLDESYTVQRVSTPVEEYLPEGVHGFRSEQVRVTELLTAPEITVLDSRNMPLELRFDEASGAYTVPLSTSPAISEEETALVLAAAQADALFAVRGTSLTELRQHFHTDSDIYRRICDADPLLTGGKSFAFDEAATQITGYYSYTEKLFSVRVLLKLNVTLSDGQVESIPWDQTYFFTANNAGRFLVENRVAGDLQQPIVTAP